MKLNNIQKRLKLAAMSAEISETHLIKAIELAKDEPIQVTMDLGIKLDKLTELRKSIWNQ